MPPRLFTPQEARAALSDVRRFAERLAECRAGQLAARVRLAELRASAAGNGHGADRERALAASREVEEAEAGIAAAIAALDELGVVVKSLDAGLIDFPSLRDGRQVFLCWQLGEDDIGHWHGLDEGFAGRKPL